MQSYVTIRYGDRLFIHETLLEYDKLFNNKKYIAFKTWFVRNIVFKKKNV